MKEIYALGVRVQYTVKKGLLGYSVRYECPSCKIDLRAPLSDGGTEQVCCECGITHRVPGAAEKARWVSEQQAKKEQAVRAKQERAEEKKRQKQAAVDERERQRQVAIQQEERALQLQLAEQARLAAQPVPVVVQQPAPQGQWRCPYCQASAGAYSKKHITSGGCLVSLLLLVFFFPLCWLGLLFTDERTYCRTCHTRLH